MDWTGVDRIGLDWFNGLDWSGLDRKGKERSGMEWLPQQQNRSKTNVKKHPEWLEAAEQIKQRVADEGYGFLLTLEELQAMLDVETVEDDDTAAKLKKTQFDMLQKMEALKDMLLYDHCIYLHNERGKGYRAMMPDEQVDKGYNATWDRVRAKLRKAIAILRYVDEQSLTDRGRGTRDHNLIKTVFVQSAMNKRKLPETIERKAISQ
jgi:hypothetical protein